jgi:hypothetical protein
MSDDQKTKDDAWRSPAEFLEALYGDPFRPETVRTGRHVVIASIGCIAVVLFRVRLTSSSLLPVDFGERPDVLPMLLALAVLMLLAIFLMRAFTDLLHDQEVAVLVTRYIERARMDAAKASAQAQDDLMADAQEIMDHGPHEGDPWWEHYHEIKNTAEQAVANAEARLGLRRLPQSLRRTRKWLEFGIPLVFALVALLLAKHSLFAFAAALIAGLKGAI